MRLDFPNHQLRVGLTKTKSWLVYTAWKQAKVSVRFKNYEEAFNVFAEIAKQANDVEENEETFHRFNQELLKHL